MASETSTNPSFGENLLRFGRDINILGAVAFTGAAILIPGPNVVLASLARLNGLQALGFELFRGWVANRR